MKYFLILWFVFLYTTYSAQIIPNESVEDLNGDLVNLTEIDTQEKPMVISFWATWCISCMQELSAINDKYVDWQDEVPFQFYAISTDDARSTKKVKMLSNAKAWDFQVLLDKNQDIMRGLNVNNIPYTLIIYKDEIVYTHVGYTLGEEDQLFEKLQSL